MNREIKFRAWDKDREYMAYQGSPDLETLQSFIFHFGDKELMQYTGLKDKNGKGKNIYEADIFNNTNKTATGIVSWHKGQWVVKFPTYQYPLYQFLENDETREVVGNVFENPELLKTTL